MRKKEIDKLKTVSDINVGGHPSRKRSGKCKGYKSILRWIRAKGYYADMVREVAPGEWIFKFEMESGMYDHYEYHGCLVISDVSGPEWCTMNYFIELEREGANEDKDLICYVDRINRGSIYEVILQDNHISCLFKSDCSNPDDFTAEDFDRLNYQAYSVAESIVSSRALKGWIM